MEAKERELAILREKLEQSEERVLHLQEQLLATQAQRVKIQGYLYKFRPFPNGFFASPWELRYFCLVDTCLKCFLSEDKIALITEMEVDIRGCTVEWEGLKREKFWTFGIRDSAGCRIVRLSTTHQSTADKWLSLLNASVGPVAIQRNFSLPLESTFSQMKASSLAQDAPGLKEEQELKKKQRVMIGSTPVHHQTKSSVLTSERLFQHPHPGLLNLGVVVLLAANFRLVLENLFKYGFRVNPFLWFQQFLWGSSQPLMLCWPVLGLSCLFTFALENLMAAQLRSLQALQKKTDEKLPCNLAGSQLVALGHIINVVFCFLMPIWLILISEEALLPSFVLAFVTIIVCMKIISFVHCNGDLRMARLLDETRPGERESSSQIETSDVQLKYPENITLSNFLYFLCAPTLTYQLNYPRTKKIRRKWLARRCGEFFIALALQVAIIDQYILPAVHNSMIPMEERNFVGLIERVLKLSIPVLYAWLIMFYIIFHLWLNILAEALRFGDREFYLDWWNAANVGDYWKMWNLPVHKWMLRTLYYPAIHRGWSRSVATLMVFFVSALVHEIVVIVPLKFTSSFPWSFVGMMMQVPLIFFSQFLQKRVGDRWGNIIFWVSFCVLGQPICLLYYYYDWIHAHSSIQM